LTVREGGNLLNGAGGSSKKKGGGLEQKRRGLGRLKMGRKKKGMS